MEEAIDEDLLECLEAISCHTAVVAKEEKKGVCYLCGKKGHQMADYDLLKILIKKHSEGSWSEATGPKGKGYQQNIQPDCSEHVHCKGLEVGDGAPIPSGGDPQANIEVGARGVTVTTTSRTQPSEWQKNGALSSTVLNVNSLYSIVSPIFVAEVEVDDVTTSALLDTGATTNVMTPAYARKLGLEPQPSMDLTRRKFTFNGEGNSCAVLN